MVCALNSLIDHFLDADFVKPSLMCCKFRLVVLVQFALANEMPGTLTQRCGETGSEKWTAAPCPSHFRKVVMSDRKIIYMCNETFLFSQPALK